MQFYCSSGHPNTINCLIIYHEKNFNLAFYPNPNTGIFVIETNHKLHMQVFNIAGELVLSQFLENGNTTIDASVLQAGIYTINLSRNAGVINKRLVIVR